MSDTPLSQRLRESTRAMHRLAERSAFMGELLAGRLALEAYVGYLRNLHALYDALETALGRLSPSPPWHLAPLARREAIAADLAHLRGEGWDAMRLAPALEAYVARIGTVSRQGPHRLAAHAYVRYLGDLSGGQAIRGVIRRAYALGEGPGTAFYAFGDGSRTDALKLAMRSALDAYGETLDPQRRDEIVDEAVDAFARHASLFADLQAGPPRAG